jgi:hypothetical protein
MWILNNETCFKNSLLMKIFTCMLSSNTTDGYMRAFQVSKHRMKSFCESALRNSAAFYIQFTSELSSFSQEICSCLWFLLSFTAASYNKPFIIKIITRPYFNVMECGLAWER